MIPDLINHIFTERGHRWRVGGTLRIPSEEDIRKALDRAAGMLYSEPVGTTLTVGGLVIEKTHTGHDVYVHVGEYA